MAKKSQRLVRALKAQKSSRLDKYGTRTVIVTGGVGSKSTVSVDYHLSPTRDRGKVRVVPIDKDLVPTIIRVGPSPAKSVSYN